MEVANQWIMDTIDDDVVFLKTTPAGKVRTKHLDLMPFAGKIFVKQQRLGDRPPNRGR